MWIYIGFKRISMMRRKTGIGTMKKKHDQGTRDEQHGRSYVWRAQLWGRSKVGRTGEDY